MLAGAVMVKVNAVVLALAHASGVVVMVAVPALPVQLIASWKPLRKVAEAGITLISGLASPTARVVGTVAMLMLDCER